MKEKGVLVRGRRGVLWKGSTVQGLKIGKCCSMAEGVILGIPGEYCSGMEVD